MDYNSLINETKDKINNYSFDGDLYDEIYSKAKERLDSALKTQTDAINAELDIASRAAIGQNALSTRSLQEELATKGLARSGESAMLRINQNVSLKNALAKLSGDALRAKAELGVAHGDKLNALDTDIAKQKTAAMEKEKGELNDRLAHLENLKEEHDKWKADYNLELYKENNRKEEAKAAAERAEAALKQAQSQIQSGTQEDKVQASGNEHFNITPATSAEKTAANLMSACNIREGKRISGVAQQNEIRRMLARLVCTSGLSVKYTQDVVYYLKLKGFDGDFDIGIATGKELKWIYGAYETTYHDVYARCKNNGMSNKGAAISAEMDAKESMLKFIASLKLNDYEIREISKLLWL